jgi:hypothetical protein
VPTALGGRTTAANNLKTFVVNGIHVPFDLNIDLEIDSFTPTNGLGPGTFRYKRDVEAMWSTPKAFDTTTGSLNVASPETAYQLVVKQSGVEKASGLYVWFDPTGLTATDTNAAGDAFFFNATYNSGTNFQQGDGNTAHAVVACSGRGKCTFGSGSCECYPGYTGQACERTSCPEDCSGHGVCQSLKRFAAYAGAAAGNVVRTLGSSSNNAVLSYAKAFDATKQYTCACDAGFRGVNCADMECPSGPDPMGGKGGAEDRDCSGRGTCDYTSGLCQCAQGFFGERCESRSTFV